MVFPAAYLTTILVEVPIVVALVVLLGIATWRRALVAALVANLLTVPLLWFVAFPLLDPVVGWLGAVLVGEALVVIGESAVYTRVLGCAVLAAGGIALGANGCSVLVGLLLGA